jgi:hypothetical protein
VAHNCNPSTQEAEVRKISIRSQSSVQNPISKKIHHKNRAGEGVDPEFKPQYRSKKKNQTTPTLNYFLLRTDQYFEKLLFLTEEHIHSRVLFVLL